MGYDRNKVIKLALEEAGYLEKSRTAYNKDHSILYTKTGGAGSDNITKYWEDLCPSLQGQPWCNCFVNYVFTHAYTESVAKKLLCTSGGWSYYTPASAGYFKNSGKWFTKNPMVGDVIYFKNSSRICHVGLVYKVTSSTVYTIEGNTSASSGVVANGGGVACKSYSLSYSRIAGYGRPSYDDDYSGDTQVVEKTTAASTTSGGSVSVGDKVKVTASELNIRSGCGTGYKILGTMINGHEFTVRGINSTSKWCKCCVHPDSDKSSTVTGWVSMNYIAKV